MKRSNKFPLAVGLLVVLVLMTLGGLAQAACAAGAPQPTWQPPTPIPWQVVPTPQPQTLLPGLAAAAPSMIGDTTSPTCLAPTMSNPVYWLILILVAASGLVLMSGFPEHQ